MNSSYTGTNRILRGLLLMSGPMNLGGALCFAPPVTIARKIIGLAEPEPFYLLVISSWILAFGVAYWWQGWTGRLNRGLMAIGAFGKLTFGSALIADAVLRQHPILVIAALPDITLGIAFAAWCLRPLRRG